jgi:hypothetical protein
MHMSMSIFEYGDGRFRLFHGEREVGWVDGRAVGFVGFDTDDDAVRAATVAYDALSAWVAKQRRTELTARRGRRLNTRTEGGERRLTLGDVSIGRLVSIVPADAAVPVRGFELQLPPRLGDSLTAAQVLDHALERHRALRQLETRGAGEAAEAFV